MLTVNPDLIVRRITALAKQTGGKEEQAPNFLSATPCGAGLEKLDADMN